MLGRALIQLEQQFPTKIDPRVVAAVNLAGALGMVYGPRIVAIRMRLADERKSKRPSASVTPFPGIDAFTPNPPGAA